MSSLTDRLNAIRDRVRRGRLDPEVIAWARKQITKKCGDTWCIREKDTRGEIDAIFNAIRKNVRYVSDPTGGRDGGAVDLYVHPKRTLRERAGDCDDQSALACSALLAVGIPARLKVVRTKESSSWNHVYVMASASKSGNGPWIPMDTTMPVKAGWEVPKQFVAEERIFEVLP